MALLLSPFCDIEYWCMIAIPTNLLPLFLSKRKLFDRFFQTKIRKQEVFNNENFLRSHELHVYELLKIVLRSIAGLHSETFLNEFSVFDKPSLYDQVNFLFNDNS